MLTYHDGEFYKDGEKLRIYSGTIHYCRVLPEYWRDRLLKLKAAGFNTVETYTCWNLHEPRKGEFDFSGIADVVRFLETAREVGLYAIVRPGPYICGEWDFGGLPIWLLKDQNLRLRCADPVFMGHIRDYFKVLLPKLVPLLETHGGNILMMQVENEYGSYGNDKTYLNQLKDLMIECGIDCLLFTSDGPGLNMLTGGTLENVLPTVNFGSDARHNMKFVPAGYPKMCTEFWCGWFDHWGEEHHTRDVESMASEVRDFLDMGANFNVFVFHGGTNFGYNAGANHHEFYTPTVTSYDYCAPLNEYGGYTPRYFALRELLWAARGEEPLPLPPAPKCQHIGSVTLREETGLFENLDRLGVVHRSALPESMEYYGQLHGLILYETVLPGDMEGGCLILENLHDRAYVYRNGEFLGKLDTTYARKDSEPFDRVAIPDSPGGTRISILVDAMGHTNYGSHITDRKGISGVRLDYQYLMGWTVTSLSLDAPWEADFTKPACRYPKLFRGSFRAESRDETFLRLDPFTKGSVWVNGFHLGRFWNRGPQKTLYLPGALLREENEILILELEHCERPEILLTDVHDLG